jgi:hypothetical protein
MKAFLSTPHGALGTLERERRGEEEKNGIGELVDGRNW